MAKNKNVVPAEATPAETPAPEAPLQEPPVPEAPVVTAPELPIPEAMPESVKESVAKLEEASKAKVDPKMPFLGQIVPLAGDKKGIVVDYDQFVKFMIGLIINVQPTGITSQFVSVAGKNRLCRDLLGSVDNEQITAKWQELYDHYNGKK